MIFPDAEFPWGSCGKSSQQLGVLQASQCRRHFAAGGVEHMTITSKPWPLFALLLLSSLLLSCQGLVSGGTASGTSDPANLKSINHIVFMVQENRSLDNYFGQLPAYWQANGFPSQQFDGLPANASNPSFDGSSTVNAYHVKTECVEDLSGSWNESHVDWNRQSPTSSTVTLDGYVLNAAKFARTPPPGGPPVFFDTAGLRAMGYYDSGDLNYYYFMASNFATSDRWFSPLMARTQANRIYLLAATSAGHVYAPASPLSIKTIFDLLQTAGISWKVYETDPGTSSYIDYFQPFATQFAANIVPVSQYMMDVKNGTLPAVAMIEGGYNSGLDEHPTNNIQKGAAYVSGLINALMTSTSWKDSAFILTYDEAGGFYDHVPPMAAVSPDGIPPSDLASTDLCGTGPSAGANCDFTFSGFRVPLIVISPFTKKNFVSHTSADYTAILKFIETRFGLSTLTKRDAAQMDMTEFFDFKDTPWATPPTPPVQATNGVCNFQSLQ
jgi:phospholipase C